MEQHPIPRQITSFEFKLIGFLTIKQFIYLLVFIGFGIVIYLLIPIPIINILMALLSGSIGAALAFIPINDRPLEVWIRNFIKRITSPTQYKFQKNNKPPRFLQDLYPGSLDQITTHIDSQQKLSQYLSRQSTPTNTQKQSINNLFIHGGPQINKKTGPQNKSVSEIKATAHNQPFLSGMVKNHKLIPLVGILIYIKKNSGSEPLRILKSNVNGVFVTYKPIEPGDYFFEIKDPTGTYLFDTIKLGININNQPIDFISKELI